MVTARAVSTRCGRDRVDPSRALEQVEASTADYAFELPREAGPRLESAYGPDSDAAKAGFQQYFISEAVASR